MVHEGSYCVIDYNGLMNLQWAGNFIDWSLPAIGLFKDSIPCRNVSKMISLASRESRLECLRILIIAKVVGKIIASNNSWTWEPILVSSERKGATLLPQHSKIMNYSRSKSVISLNISSFVLGQSTTCLRANNSAYSAEGTIDKEADSRRSWRKKDKGEGDLTVPLGVRWTRGETLSQFVFHHPLWPLGNLHPERTHFLSRRVRDSTLRMAQRARSEEAWKYSTQITLPGAFQLKGLCVGRGLWTLGTLPGHKRATSDTDLTPFKPHFFHLLNGLTVPASQDSGWIMWEQEAQALLSHHRALLTSRLYIVTLLI